MVTPQSISRSEEFPQTRVSVKGQTVIPRGIRRLLNISAGSRLRWEVRGEVILVYPLSQDPLGASIGVLAGHGLDVPDLLESRHRTSP